MNKTVKLLILIIAFAAVIVGASVLYNNLAQNAPDTIVSTAPETSGEDEDPTSGNESEEPKTETESESEADVSAEGEKEEESEPERSLAPDFTVYDIDGNPVKLSDLRGKPVVLNFWASWCGPCRSEMPVFENAYKQYGEDIHFFMVNYTNGKETVETASTFIAEMGYTFPVYYDSEFAAAGTYGVYSIPVTYFIDAEGYGVAMANGAINADVMEQGLGMLNK